MIKRLVILAALLALVGCAPAPAFPTPVPTATAVPTATPVTFPTPLPTATPVFVPISIITLFDKGDVQVFLKDQDVTDAFRRVGGLYRSGTLVLWAELTDEGALPDNAAGPLYLKANNLPFGYGGIGSFSVGQAFVTNGTGGDAVQGVAQWVFPPGDAPLSVQILVPAVGHTDLKPMTYKPDWPYNWHYGLRISAMVQLP
jgi:hypothetical protein